MLTIDAVDETSLQEHGMTRAEQDELLAGPLRDSDYMIEGSLLTLRAPCFDRAAVLAWAKVCLEHFGHQWHGFIEVSFNEMAQWAVSHHFPKSDGEKA